MIKLINERIDLMSNKIDISNMQERWYIIITQMHHENKERKEGRKVQSKLNSDNKKKKVTLEY